MSTSDLSNAFSKSCRWLWLTAWLGLFTQTGCTSAITTAAMREAFSHTLASLAQPLPHAAERATASDEEQEAADVAETSDAEANEEARADAAKPTLTLDQAVERAVSRLSAAGQLDAATQATLLTMLESTNPEDWPAAIDAFTASLEANRPPRPAASAAAPSPDNSVSQTEPTSEPDVLTLPAPTGETVTAQVEPTAAVIEPVANFAVDRRKPQPPVQPAMLRPEPRAEAMPAVIEPAPAVIAGEQETDEQAAAEPVASEPEDPADKPIAPPLAVRNPCFVSRVKAWGVVDRFPTQAFRRGQDVIVYFELEQLSCRESSTGHSTSIDTAFRLVGADGSQIRSWTFEPVDETCLSPRRDYFARYFLRMPDNAPVGPCRLEFVVTDRLAGASTQSHLDLEIADRE